MLMIVVVFMLVKIIGSVSGSLIFESMCVGESFNVVVVCSRLCGILSRLVCVLCVIGSSV